MKDLLQLIATHIPNAITQILKSDSKIKPVDVPPTSDELAIAFNVEGIFNGTLAIFFSDASAISRRFLTVTIGDPEAAEIGESCHEVANQVLGLLFGTLSNDGSEVRLASFGETLTTDVAKDWIENNDYLTTLTTEDYGSLHLYFNNKNPDTKVTALDETSDNNSSIRVMIVDDSPVMCAFLKKIFSEGNYDIVGIAKDGLEALEMFKELRPELVTLDIMMPKMRGTDVLKEIMLIDSNTTVVMASSIADAKTVMNCLRMGAKRYIVKPYDKEAVIAAIDKALLVKKD